MPWVRVDDELHAHPKIRLAWKCRPALGLHLLALSYCGRWSPDAGCVPAEFVEEKVPDLEERNAATEALVGAGLWVAADDGWTIHDWGVYNGQRDRSEHARAAAKARWSRQREQPANDAHSMPEHMPEHQSSNARASVEHMPEHMPEHQSSNAECIARGKGVVVVRSEGTSQGNGELDARAVEVDRLCALFSDLLRERTDTPASSTKHRVTGRWRTEMRRLIERDGRDPAEIEAAIRWVDKDPFWSSNVLSVPTLRKQYDRLRLRAARDTGGRGPERPASVSELLDRAAAIRAEEGAA